MKREQLETLRSTPGFEKWMETWVKYCDGIYRCFDPSNDCFFKTAEPTEIPDAFKGYIYYE